MKDRADSDPGDCVYCPECGAEYRSGAVHCADCGVELVADRPEVERGADFDEELSSDPPRPRTVVIAVWIAVADLAASAAVYLALGVSGQTYSGSDGAHWATIGGAVLGFVLAFGVPAGLLAALAFRRRWAYFLYVLFYLLGSLSTLSSARDTFTAGWPWPSAWNVGMFVVQTAVVVLLLLPESRAWFRRPRVVPDPAEDAS